MKDYEFEAEGIRVKNLKDKKKHKKFKHGKIRVKEKEYHIGMYDRKK